MLLTLFFQHLDLQVFIFGVFYGVVIRTVVILITEAAGVKHLVSWGKKITHQNGSVAFHNYFLVQLKVIELVAGPNIL